MSTPLATAIVEYLVSHLEQISVANGYNTDAGANVHTEDVGTPDPLTDVHVVVVATGTPEFSDPRGRYGRELEIHIEFKYPLGLESEPNKLGWKLASDIDRALVNARKVLDSASGTTPPQGLITLEGDSLDLPRREGGSSIQAGLAVWKATTDKFFTDQIQ